MIRQVNYAYDLRKNGSIFCQRVASFYEEQNTLRVTYADNVARKLELLDHNGIVVACAEASSLTAAKRKIADAQRSSGFILNPILFLQRMWEMIESEAADIVA